MSTDSITIACVWTVLSFSAGSAAIAADEDAAIVEVLTRQSQAWNRGDLEGFMETYWKSDQLTFSGGGRTVRGWQATLERYKRRYPDRAAMGHLTFRDLEVTRLCQDAALVLGRWKLAKDEPAEGNFTLVLRKISGRWRIVHDHSSQIEQDE